MKDVLKELEKINIVKRCPRCNGLSLTYTEGKIKCTDCGYEEKIPDIR